MVHCGFEATSVNEAFAKPWEILKVAIGGIRTDGAMAKDVPLDGQRPADYVFSRHVQNKLTEIKEAETATSSHLSAAE